MRCSGCARRRRSRFRRRITTTRASRSPSSALRYTVMNWWDQGYWIVQAAHRVPVSNPTQGGAPVSAAFLTASDDSTALERLAEQRAKYVIVDWELPFREGRDGALEGRFQSLADWAGVPTSRYYSLVLHATHRRGSVETDLDLSRAVLPDHDLSIDGAGWQSLAADQQHLGRAHQATRRQLGTRLLRSVRADAVHAAGGSKGRCRRSRRRLRSGGPLPMAAGFCRSSCRRITSGR